MATYFAFFTRNSPLFLPKKRSYLTHLLKYKSQFYNRTQVKIKKQAADLFRQPVAIELILTFFN